MDKSSYKSTDGSFDRSIVSREGKFISIVITVEVRTKHCPFHDKSNAK